ncbi:MAG: helix-turn-helix domain-containing protein, partial [Candidatus Paceibacterota bacterium]
MQSLKNVISLNQAAKISGYTQDYLGYLIRSGEIKGVKKGGIWFTTEEEITHYISKQKAIHRKLVVKDFLEKVSNKKLAIRDFISHLSPRNFLVSSLVLFVAFSSTGFYFFKKYDADLLPTFRTPSFVLADTTFRSKIQNISLPTFPTLPTFPNPFPVFKKIGKVYVDGIANVRVTVENSTRDFTIARINSAKEKISNNKKLVADYKIKTKVSSVVIAKNKIDVGTSLTNFSDGVSYGWGTFIGGIINNAENSANNTKKFASALGSSLSSSVNSLSKASQIKIATPKVNLASVANIPSPKLALHLPTISFQADRAYELTASVGSSLTNASSGVSSGWGSFIGGIINNAKGSANGFARGMDSFTNNIRSSARSFLGITDVNPKIYIQEVPVIVKVPEIASPSPVGSGPSVSRPTAIVQNTIQKRDVFINQYDPSVLPRLQGIELAILNNINHNSTQTDRVYISTGNNIGSAIHSVTQSGTLNAPTLNDAIFKNFTSTGRSDFTRVPTLAHAFTTWPLGTSNASNATLVINPAESIANGNLIGASVADVVKFIVDAEGNIYANSVVLTGSVTSGATTVASLSVLDNTILGDAPTDTITTNGRWNSHILPITDNLYNIGSATNRWASIYTSNINLNTNGTNALFSTFVGANSDGLNLFIGGGGQNSVGAIGSTISGSSNTSLGINTLPANTTGHYNTAIGALALFSNTTGLENTAVGRGALYYNTSAIENTAIGSQAMKYNTTGDLNTGLGT